MSKSLYMVSLPYILWCFLLSAAGLLKWRLLHGVIKKILAC